MRFSAHQPSLCSYSTTVAARQNDSTQLFALAFGDLNKAAGNKKVFMELNGQLRTTINIREAEKLFFFTVI